MNMLECLLVYVDDYCIIGHKTLQHASKKICRPASKGYLAPNFSEGGGLNITTKGLSMFFLRQVFFL